MRLAIDQRLHLADLQLVGVWMRRGFENFCHAEIGKFLRRVFDAFDLKAKHRELLGNFLKRCVSFKRLLQPGEGELHDDNPPARVGTSSAENP